MRQPTLLFLLAATACQSTNHELEEPPVQPPISTRHGEKAPVNNTVKELPVAPEKAPSESKRLALPSEFSAFQRDVQSVWSQFPGHRAAIVTDKPLYRPGETIWFSGFDLPLDPTLDKNTHYPITVKLLDPSGGVVEEGTLTNTEGLAGNFTLAEGISGGRFVIRFEQAGKTLVERPIIVNVYEAPRVQKKLDFARQAYGAGDVAQATITLKRPTGELLVNQKIDAIATVDGVELKRFSLTTNKQGVGLVKFQLPKSIERGEGLLTLLINDGGVTESISRPIPLVAKRVELAFFPEGGDLVTGLPSTVYLRGRKLTGKPADLTGKIVDDQGKTVTTFSTLREGMGRFQLTPKSGRSYHAVVTSPSSIKGEYALPTVKKEGCSLHVYDDFSSQKQAVVAGVWCTSERSVVLQAVRGEQLLDSASVVAGPSDPGVIHLADSEPVVGAIRVTAFTTGGDPLTERLVFRNESKRLHIEVKPKKSSVSPRQEVVLDIQATSPSGEPVKAALALSVVDKTMLSYADDKEPHLLSSFLLQQEVEDKIFEPNRYFDPKTKNRLAALDLVMGTYGWRRFNWVRKPTDSMIATLAKNNQIRTRVGNVGAVDKARAEGFGRGEGGFGKGAGRPVQNKARKGPMPPMAVVPVAAAPPAPPPPPVRLKAEEKRNAAPMAQKEVADPEADLIMAAEAMPAEKPMGRARRGPMAVVGLKDDFADFGGLIGNPGPKLMVVREFPVPHFSDDDTGPRHDFRDTIYWNPHVVTDEKGKAQVSFPSSDAITEFQITASGAGANTIGRSEAHFNNKLPFSMALKLPRAVTEGDVINVPLKLSNELDRALSLSVVADIGEGLSTDWKGVSKELAANSRNSESVSLRVTGKNQEAKLSFSATGSGQTDAFVRTIQIESKGFPQRFEASTDLSGKKTYQVDLGEAIEGTAVASVRLYPGPVATLLEGMEGMLREPGGCFEQTSSSNYPNIMVMQYLEENELAEPEISSRAAGMLQRGYKKLTGFETKEKGYEWFGGTPAHEALTAYGLVEFLDMKQVIGSVDDKMVQRTQKYLLSRRDGKGGYKRSSQALDSFGRASDDVTNAYITYSLALAGSGSELTKELKVVKTLALTSKDTYILALSAGALLHSGNKSEGVAAVKRLIALQDADGGFTKADHSITRSGGTSLAVEATSLAVLAMIDAGEKGKPIRSAVKFLTSKRSGYGSFGSTQATILALKALTNYANASRATQSSGTVRVSVNGELVEEFSYEAGHQGAIVLEGLGAHLRSGSNSITVENSGQALPMSLVVDYRSDKPASSDEAAVRLSTDLKADQVPVGETVQLVASVTNITNEGLPMTLARVGIPGGLAPQTWQLEDLRKENKIAYYELTPKEVILYWRDMGPESSKEVTLDLVAEVPGTYTSSSSSAYLYYTAELKQWVAGQKIVISP